LVRFANTSPGPVVSARSFPIHAAVTGTFTEYGALDTQGAVSGSLPVRTTAGFMALAEEHQPNLAVLDLHLPGGTGVTLCTRLRGRFGTGLHIAMLTADPTEDARRDAIAAGADAFLTKPFSPVKLIELLETWSRHRREPVR
jgi:CheY-like chemotaxis protein